MDYCKGCGICAEDVRPKQSKWLARGTTMADTVIMTGNTAAATAAKLCQVQVVAAYPITPKPPLRKHSLNSLKAAN